MTIHWKALAKHFLMELLVFRFIIGGKNIFSEFLSKTGGSVLKGVFG
jgi:hypothetical protein